MKNQKGITLIALVITIIVLIILAAVSIAMLTGDNGILTNANQAKEDTKIGEIKDKIDTELEAFKADLHVDGKVTYATMKSAVNTLVTNGGYTITLDATTDVTFTASNTVDKATYDGLSWAGATSIKITKDSYEGSVLTTSPFTITRAHDTTPVSP